MNNGQTILFLNAPAKALSSCMTGLSLWRILKRSTRFRYVYALSETMDRLLDTAHEVGAAAILNNHLSIIPEWFTTSPVRAAGLKQAAFLTHGMAFALPGFDAYLVPDPRLPRNGNVWGIGRPLPAATIKPWVRHEVPVIGTAGHLLPHKDFPATVARVIREFDRAHIRILMSTAEMAPFDLPDAHQCQDLVTKCGKPIDLEIETRPMPIDQLTEWLAENDLNVYLYAPGTGGPAPAMSPDVALAARRPIAVTKNASGLGLFHGLTPSVCVEDSNLRTILKNGIAPLAPLYERFSDDRVLADVEAVLATL